jgi:muramoyltetrapeptide carboxypeptidase
MRAFGDRTMKAIFCTRAGHGTTRLLSLLDYSFIRKHPKIFVGYSDVTALHCAMLNQASLMTFHGPMLNADFVRHRFPDLTRHGLFRTLMNPEAAGSICAGYRKKTVRVLRGGMASGRLIGGNLTLLCALVGTPWQPVFDGGILFLEEVNEAPYRVDRMLTQLLNAGLLQRVSGIAIGQCDGCVDVTAKKRGEFRQTLEDVFRERLLPLKVPVVTGLPFGHIDVNATLPVGAWAELDGRKGNLIVTESAVR